MSEFRSTATRPLAQYASAFAHTALNNIQREFPNKLDHVMNDASEVQSPRMLHPVFYGSFDWHSSVHMHWLLVKLLRDYPDFVDRARIRAVLDAHLTPANVAQEIDYLRQPSRQSFERTYGWAWLLKLQTELIQLAEQYPLAIVWRDALQPLAELFVERYFSFLPLAQFPIRAGTHSNSAFGLNFALDYAECIQHIALRKLIVSKANAWFGRDQRYPARYEPSSDDFLSGGLMEAALMRRVVDSCSYADWWELFCPAPDELGHWLLPVPVSDRTDPKLSHLDGLNLSRAWCWKKIEKELPAPLRSIAAEAIEAHLAAALPHVVRGSYAGTHWLASFAALALSTD